MIDCPDRRDQSLHEHGSLLELFVMGMAGDMEAKTRLITGGGR
jgi:hypothetical protein